MSKRKQNDTTRDAGSRLDRRQFLGAGAALGAAGMGVMFTGLTREVLAQSGSTSRGGSQVNARVEELIEPVAGFLGLPAGLLASEPGKD